MIPFPPGGVLPDLQQYFLLSIYEDGLESQLDPRDVGQIDLARTAYLVTINQSGIPDTSIRTLSHFTRIKVAIYMEGIM